jgi:DNA polymerase III alpha subunit
MQWFKDEFGDDYYIEVMPHNSAEINKGIIELADAMQIKIVVTPDCHHSDSSQKEIQELMLILNTHAKLEKDATYEKSKKKETFMDRLDYLYGAEPNDEF